MFLNVGPWLSEGRGCLGPSYYLQMRKNKVVMVKRVKHEIKGASILSSKIFRVATNFAKLCRETQGFAFEFMVYMLSNGYNTKNKNNWNLLVKLCLCFYVAGLNPVTGKELNADDSATLKKISEDINLKKPQEFYKFLFLNYNMNNCLKL